MHTKTRVIRAAIALMLAAALGPTTSMAISETSEALDDALRLQPRLDHGAENFAMCAACHGT